jgi:hypothetical protein
MKAPFLHVPSRTTRPSISKSSSTASSRGLQYHMTILTFVSFAALMCQLGLSPYTSYTLYIFINHITLHFHIILDPQSHAFLRKGLIKVFFFNFCHSSSKIDKVCWQQIYLTCMHTEEPRREINALHISRADQIIVIGEEISK